jgi:hypothetical protein
VTAAGPRGPRHVGAFRVAALALVVLAVAVAVRWGLGSWDLLLRVAGGVHPWLAGLVGITP